MCLLLFPDDGDSQAISSARADALFKRVQTETLEAHVITLQENITVFPYQIAYRTRNVHHREATDNAVRYITSQFRRSPRLQVSEQIVGGIRNVVAVLPPHRDEFSSLGNQRVFVICAHYDTQAVKESGWNPLTSNAPGANKNGTGVAAMLEIANLLSQYEYEHEIRFIALGGEELGSLGSRYYVRQASQQQESTDERKPENAKKPENIVAVFNLDMLGYNWKRDLVEVLTNKDSAWISQALTIANKWYGIDLIIRRTQDEFIDISAHKSFWDAGHHAVTLIENSTPWRDSRNYDANPFYHTSRDTVDKVNFGLVRKVTQLVLVTMDSLLTDMFQPSRNIPSVTLNLPATVTQNPFPIGGTFYADFPIDIIVHPSKTEALLDRETRTYTAMVPLSPGENTLRVTVRYALGATSIEKSIVLEQAFAWEEVVVFPNPAQSDGLTEFRVEANIEMTDMTVLVYDAAGNLIKRIAGVADRRDSRIWRTWWNQQTSYGLAVSPGVYICHISVVAKGETYTYLEKLAILR